MTLGSREDPDEGGVVVDVAVANDKRGFLLFLLELVSRLVFSLHSRILADAAVDGGDDDEDESVVRLLRFRFFLDLDVIFTVDTFSSSLFDKRADNLNPGMRFTSALDLKRYLIIQIYFFCTNLV